MDFVNDALADGRKLRCLTIVDACTRECPAIEVDTSLPGERVARVLDRLVAERGAPTAITVDTGPELAGKALDAWAYRHGVRLDFITPGRPVENACIASFNGKFRDECLHQHWFLSLPDARFHMEHYRRDDNEVRPHSALNKLCRWCTCGPTGCP
jgi:putative transposase